MAEWFIGVLKRMWSCSTEGKFRTKKLTGVQERYRFIEQQPDEQDGTQIPELDEMWEGPHHIDQRYLVGNPYRGF